MTLTETNIEHLSFRERIGSMDIYDVVRLEGEDSQLAFAVATDRINRGSGDHQIAVPDKGLLNARFSSYWFDALSSLLRHHLVGLASEREKLKDIFTVREALTLLEQELRSRTMVVYKADPLPVEVIVRGYLTPSAVDEYKDQGTISDVEMPVGLKIGAALPKPVVRFGWDWSLDWETYADQLGRGYVDLIKETALAAYTFAHEKSQEAGFILAEAALRFSLQGVPLGEGAQGIRRERLLLVGEPFVPESTLYWDGSSVGDSPQDAIFGSLDEWITGDSTGALTSDVAEQVMDSYRNLVELLIER